MKTNSYGNPLVLEEAIKAINTAETLFFDARNLHTTGWLRRWYDQVHLPAPVTRMRYYSRNCAGMSYVRVESAVIVLDTDITSLFIKNRDGVWHVLPEGAAEVSTCFTPDRLLGVFPFFRLISIPEHPYELTVDKSKDNIEQIVVNGHLVAKPLHCEEDIASDFTYTLHTRNSQLSALNERTFAGRSLHLEFDRWSTNELIDHKLFELPQKSKVTVANMDQYMDFKQQYHANGYW